MTLALVTCAGGFLISLDVSVANALLPAIGGSFHGASRATLAWVITAYAIVFAAVLVPAGRVADRVGRRRSLVAGLGLFAFGSTLCGVAPSVPCLIAGRIVQGIAAAVVAPASLGLLLAGLDDVRRSNYASRWAGVSALGICAGPLLGGALTSAGGWRWAFLINLPLIAAMVLVGRQLPDTPRLRGRPVTDLLSAVLLAAGTAAISYAISEAPGYGLLDRQILGSLIGGALCLALFVRRSHTVASPLLDLRLLTRRSTGLAIVATTLYSSAFFGLLLTFMLFLTGIWGFSVVVAGLAILPIGVIVAAMTLRVAPVADRIGFRLPLTTGSLLMAGGLLLATFCLAPRFSPTWLPIALVTGTGIGLCYPLLVSAALAGLPAADLAAATAVSQCARQIGAAIGVAVAVASLGTRDVPTVSQFHLAWLLEAGFCGLAAVCAATMPHHSRARRPGDGGSDE